MSTVIVTEADLADVSDQGSVVLFVGTVEDTERRVRFAVDHRMAGGLYEAVMVEGEVRAGVEGWQMMGVPA